MKKIIILIVTICLLSCRKEVIEKKILTKTSNNKESANKNLLGSRLLSEEIFRCKINQNKLSLENLENFDFDKDTIFTIVKNYILQIDIKNKSINKLGINTSAFNNSDKIQNFDYLFDFKKLNNNKYILENYNSIVIYDKKFKSTNSFFTREKMLNSFLSDDYNLVCDYNGVKLLNNNLKIIDSLNVEFMDEIFVKSNFGFGYFAGSTDIFNEFSVLNGKIKKQKLNPIENIVGISDIDNFYVALVTKEFIIGFYYNNRGNIYFIDKNNYNIVGKVKITDEFTLPQSLIQNEEGKPNLKIILKDNYFYVLGISKNKELILLKIKKL